MQNFLSTAALLCACGLAAAAPQASIKAKHHAAGKAHVDRKSAAAHKAADDDAPDLVTYGRRDDVMRFAAEVAERHGFEPAALQDTLAQARYVPAVARLLLPPKAGTAKNWAAYRGRFVEPVRIRAGVAFWKANEAALMKAEQTYGVPPEVIAGVIGVETIYGQQMGGFRVIDALATLGFDFPAGRSDRSAFFRDELESYLVMCRAAASDPLQLKGSYAGAMGMPQFMPSSVNRYAVDGDGDGAIDLRSSPADVIASVAHYLAEFGWQRGMPIRFAVAAPVDARARAALLVPDIVPTFTAAGLADNGAKLDEAAAGFEGLLALVELQNGEAAPSYVAGTANFYAITRYNWSSYYAMAVIELGEAVARGAGR